ncbi:MAG TPA: histidinol-phosphate transaminase [Bacteroidetes bacterium]|nr:MAG: histidinol-phosphate transaminase [Rhodothermaceae bacterium TMED105]HBW00217.1 histidinol-phosphate transaminase [Bacteroidota bacterium]|tara:strand:- start:2509 stop:3603 length:1095 start_codon:yes stop_codon:yes gene_type:complete
MDEERFAQGDDGSRFPIRQHLLSLKPYRNARQEFEGQASVWLDANENGWGGAHQGAYSRYPDPFSSALRQRIASLKGVSDQAVFVGHGSDEVIDLLIRLTCEPGSSKILLSSPTYGMMAVNAAIHGVECVDIPLMTPDYGLRVEDLIETMRKDPSIRVLYVCSPNNPTGSQWSLQQCRALAEVAAAQGVMMLLDEAYIDYAPGPSMARELFWEDMPTLVIMQTLSKAWGQAALRVGWAIAHPDVVAWFDKIKPPYSIAEPVQTLALEALEDPSVLQKTVAFTLAEKRRLLEDLPKIQGVQHVFESDANFILFQHEAAGQLYDWLTQHGIVIRDRRRDVPNALRVTLGTTDENSSFLDACKRFKP